MKKCTYSLKINGETLTFPSELDLNTYLYKNIGTVSTEVTTGDTAIYSLSTKAQKTASLLAPYLNNKTTGYSVSELLDRQQPKNNLENIGYLRPTYNEENFRKKAKELYKLTDEELDDLIAKNEKTLEFSNFMHGLLSIALSTGINSKKYRDYLDKLDSDEFKEFIGEGKDTVAAKKKISNVTKVINNKLQEIYINGGGTIYPEFRISAKDYLDQDVIGKIDILAIDGNGNVHIIDLKLSKHDIAHYTL